MASFNPNCRSCSRLAGFLDQLKTEKPDYFNAPVDAFGDSNPKLLIIGLAPGMHGANRTGRPFTGDASGHLLYQTLFDLGLASQAESKHAKDKLVLKGVRITNAVKCLPPQNKPDTSEIKNCNVYLIEEINSLPTACNILALGKLAHDAILRAYDLKLSSLIFAHAAEHKLPDGRKLVDSYHCSRYNTQTRRLTEAMFKQVILQAAG
ncbi:uracil DNA glycosylase superfamily protein [Mariprofundus micogutta]|uniref:Type-5 uracil-DNA glycosylase n=1 Tax=Mariprofundus micogutta TaxID=1921010 RepID=A0A1L8CQZ0_9PROT|nr:uracil-DNA glycosylase [Mariprofundus micogutta]GAV21307.1 uracil DNA glycosylase superfamily protein [Mariprofundus micogutta]